MERNTSDVKVMHAKESEMIPSHMQILHRYNWFINEAQETLVIMKSKLVKTLTLKTMKIDHNP